MNLFDLVAKLTLNSSDFESGLTDAQKKINNVSSNISKAFGTVEAASNALLGTVAVVGAGVAAAIGKAVWSFADYEQLLGGVQTLFKDSWITIAKYADQAYETAGMSANQYMETVTSFSASLIQGLGGDTAKAAEVANMAVVDMSDNANKMGTSIEMIQNAYQGFAKDNYMMLDNLKLGYGGTAGEMARLVNDSGVLGKSFKATAENIKDIPFAKMIEAIHEVQTEMGITGTTALEASETISGSFNSMKASWSNFLVSMLNSNGDRDYERVFGELFETTQTFATNIYNVLDGLVYNLMEIWGNFVPPELQAAIYAVGTAIAIGIVPALLSLAAGAIAAMIPLAPLLLAGAALGAIFYGIQNTSGAAKAGLIALAAVVGTFTAVMVAMTVASKAAAIAEATKNAVIVASATATKIATAAQWLLNAAMSANPITLIIIGIEALVAAFVLLWNNCEGFRNFWINLWDVISNTAVKAWNAITNAFTTAWGSITNTFTTAWNSIADFFTKTIPEFWDSVIAAFVDGWNAFVSFWTTTIPTFFINAMIAIGVFFEQLPYMLSVALGQVLGYIVLFAIDLWNFATVTIPQWIEQMIKFFSELPGKIWAWLVQAATQIYNWGVDIQTKANTAMTNFINAVITFFSELPGKIWNWLVQASIQIYNWGVDIYNKSVIAMTNFINSVIKFFSELPGKVWNWLVQTANKVTNWGSDLSKKGSQAASDLWNSIVDGIKKLPDEIYKVGVNIVNGLWNGISSMISTITSKVNNFVQGIKDGFTSVTGFDIGSPSKWAKKTFAYVVEGGIEGFDSKMSALEKATSGVTDTVKSGFDIGNISYESSLAGQSSGGASNGDIYGVMSNMLGVISTYLPDLANMQVTLDGKTLVGGLAKPMDNELGVMNALAARGSA